MEDGRQGLCTLWEHRGWLSDPHAAAGCTLRCPHAQVRGCRSPEGPGGSSCVLRMVREGSLEVAEPLRVDSMVLLVSSYKGMEVGMVRC